MLLDRGLTAQFFLLAGRLGEPGRLDHDDVRALADAGMSIGSHGWAHRDWRRLAADEAETEFEAAPGLLSELVGRPVSRVAVPFGCYDRTVLRRLRQAGVEHVYTSDGGGDSGWVTDAPGEPGPIVPEPGGVTLALAGLAGLLITAIRRRRRQVS